MRITGTLVIVVTAMLWAQQSVQAQGYSNPAVEISAFRQTGDRYAHAVNEATSESSAVPRTNAAASGTSDELANMWVNGVVWGEQQSPGTSGETVQAACGSQPDSSAAGCGPCDPACWQPCYSLWGDVLFLSPRDAGFGYAQHVDGPTQNASPIAPLNMVAPDYELGFRVGAAYHPDQFSRLSAQYWYFRSDTSDSINLPGGTGFIKSFVTHPSTNSVDMDSLAAQGRQAIDFDIVDVNFEQTLFNTCNASVDAVFGLRYAQLDQEFQGDFLIAGATTVRSSTAFQGFGPRTGLKLRRNLGSCFHVYGEGFLDVLAGRFDSDYTQDNIMVGNQVRSGFEDDRLVPQLEAELGVGWENACGNFSVRAGYYMGAWFNSVTTAEFIEAARADTFTDDNLDESITFDGLTVRAQLNF